MVFLVGLWDTSCLKRNLHLHGRLHLTWPAAVFSPSPSSAQLSSVDLTTERKRSTSYTEILVWDEPKWLTGSERGQRCLGAWPWEASWKPEEKRPRTCCQEQETISVGATLGGNALIHEGCFLPLWKLLWGEFVLGCHFSASVSFFFFFNVSAIRSCTACGAVLKLFNF